MAKFFKKLYTSNLYDDWADILDWLFDDKKFEGWGKGAKRKLTHKVKKLLQLEKILYEKKTLEHMQTLSINRKKVYVYNFSSGESESVSIIRHIRNSIAHSHINISTKYITLQDFKTTGEKTSDMRIPVDFIEKVYNEYKIIKKS